MLSRRSARRAAGTRRGLSRSSRRLTTTAICPSKAGSRSVSRPGTYKTGDYWLIPARAFIGEFSGDIEWPQDGTAPLALPPHGIDHHYCKLGIVEFDGKETFEVLSDCRDIFPPLTELEQGGGCCDIVVHPGESIQAALDSLPKAGGAVCLKAGLHEITEAIRIERSNVSLCGCPGARVVRRDDVFLVSVFSPEGADFEHVTIEGIQFEVEGGKAGSAPGGAPFLTPALITVDTCSDFALRHCALAVAGLQDQPQVPVAVAAGVVAGDAVRMKIHGNEMRRVTLGVVALHSSQLEVSDNVMTGPLEITGAGFGSLPGGDLGVWIDNVFGWRHRIERNRIINFWIGVQIGTDGLEGGSSIIADNEIVRSASGETGAEEMRFAIDITADQCVVRDNQIDLPSSLCGGIQVVGLEARIEDNLLESAAPEPALGIRLGRPDDESDLSSDSGVIRGNRLTGRQLAIWVERSRAVEVIDNVIEGSTEFQLSTGILLNKADEARVVGNRIEHAEVGVHTAGGRSCRLLDNHLLNGKNGISILQATAIEVSRNRVEAMRASGLSAFGLYGTATFSGNRFEFCAYDAGMEFSFGILFALAEVQIDGCEIVNTGVAPDFSKTAALTWGILGLFVWDCRIHGNLIGYTTLVMPNPAAEHRAIWLWGLLEYAATDKFTLGGSALLLDNKLRGPGKSALVQLFEWVVSERLALRFSRVTFSNNDCLHLTVAPTTATPTTGSATVSLTGRRIIVTGNQIESFPTIPPVDFHGSAGVFLGNSADAFAAGFSGVPTPQQNFNSL